MSKLNSRRDFLQHLGLGAAALSGAGLLVPRTAAAGLIEASLTPKALLDRLASPAQALPLADIGDGYYYLRGTGMPDHPTGQFPNAHCPGAILPRSNDPRLPLRITKSPSVASHTTALNGWLFGMAVNGVVFDPTGPFWNGDKNSGWQFEVLTYGKPFLGIDFNNAHVQPTGEYHYHGAPQSLIVRLQQEQARRNEGTKMILLGWSADGFPVYIPYAPRDPNDPGSPVVEIRSSYQQRTGVRPSASPGGHYETPIFVQDFEYRPGTGDLDECNGRFGVTPEFPQGIYHYFITNQFPFVPRFWKGTPDASFYHGLPGLAAVPPELLNIDYSRT